MLLLHPFTQFSLQSLDTFKRTRRYTIADFELLLRVVAQWNPIYTVAHVLAEVSNLTDLPGAERLKIRQVLKQTIALLSEEQVPSVRAADDPVYPTLGLVDAAIATVARIHACTVLTDDLDLYLMLHRGGLEALNFTHLRARALGV